MDPSCSTPMNALNSNHPPEAKLIRSMTDIACSTISVESYAYSRTASEVSSYSDTYDTNSTPGDLSPLQWPMAKILDRASMISSRLRTKQPAVVLDDQEEACHSADLEMMKERFSKLLLGEDMSGSGKGVSTALAISNAITNLYATVFGQFKRLEPLSKEMKIMWKKEMGCLLSVCDYIVEFAPVVQTLPDGTEIQVMENRPRSDIAMNLPALCKLDAMLLDILDNFHDKEFWYIEEETMSPKVGAVGSFRRVFPRNDEKWWLPVPCIPPCGLSEKSRKRMQQHRKCADQIYKAARSINSGILGEMEIPESYLATLPKSGRASVGDAVYKYMTTADAFSPDYLLNHLEIKSEHDALDAADRIEASMCVWKQKAAAHSHKSSWVKMVDGDKKAILAGRAESLLFCLKQRYPELSQTTLDSSKIQYSKNVGQAILESYSRVLESLAYNVMARIGDVLHVDSSVRNIDD